MRTAFGPSASGPCPCRGATDERPYAACCGPLHRAERQATTAEELMRSRYSAFAVGDEPYLLRTWHPRTRPERVDLDPATRWTGLTVLGAEAGGPDDEDGVVEFVATWTETSAPSAGGGSRRGELHEVSRFARRAGRWFYVDGDQR